MPIAERCENHYDPDPCVTCRGVGGKSERDYQGVAPWGEQVAYFDPCADCWDKGVCPGCGEPIDTRVGMDDAGCESCGWIYDPDRETVVWEDPEPWD